MRNKKKFADLEFRDAFLFAATMEDEELCKRVLERILEIPIKAVRVHTEDTIFVDSDYRGIRLDVHANDGEGSIYNVEMQVKNEGNLPKRSRYYQSQMDAVALEPGMKFNQLPRSFVIFICTFDPFGREFYRYTYEYQCRESGDFLDDGTCRVFLNTKGKNQQDVSPELVRFLQFADNSKCLPEVPEDELLRELHGRIRYLKGNRRMEERYMLFGELLDEERKLGREQGLEQGLEQGEKRERTLLLSLITAMTADGRAAELSRLESEPEFLEEMLKFYKLKT